MKWILTEEYVLINVGDMKCFRIDSWRNRNYMIVALDKYEEKSFDLCECSSREEAEDIMYLLGDLLSKERKCCIEIAEIKERVQEQRERVQAADDEMNARYEAMDRADEELVVD